MKTNKFAAFLGTMLLILSTQALSGTVDTIQADANNYFTPSDALKTSDPYYRDYSQDWGWTHNAISNPFTSASISITAWDVDSIDPGYNDPEIDSIYAYNTTTSSWQLLGNLAGTNDTWSDTTFNLDSSWFDSIAKGLQVRIDIDITHNFHAWTVSLEKSVLNLEGGTPSPVPLPAAAWLFGSGLIGLLGFARKRKTA